MFSATRQSGWQAQWLTLLALATVLTFDACDRKAPETKAPEPKAPPKVAYVASREREPFHNPRCEWALKMLPENV
jgi:hypothetical protein